MSKLTEYLKLLPKGIPNIAKIIEGFVNDVKFENGTLSQEDLEVIVGRRLICSQCPFNSVNATKMGIYNSARTDEHCIHCGCPIRTKTSSLSSNCGIEEFNKNNPDHKLELKWNAVK